MVCLSTISLLLAPFFFPAATRAALVPSKTVRTTDTSPFVTVKDGKFVADGKPFKFTGTDAYWLHHLSDDAINATLSDIASRGLKVVRTWAFDDIVGDAPPGVVFFQQWKDGVATINEPGLQRLDVVVKTAETLKLKLLLGLSNNWNPNVGAIGTQRPHGSISNDYGGADVYVSQFKQTTHDTFFTDDQIKAAYKKYIATVIARYANSPAVFSWELINDPRCHSTIDGSKSCTPQTITKWTAELSTYVKTIDTNHLVNSGDGGFYCVDCPKLFPFVPPPTTSNTPGGRRKRSDGLLTREQVMAARAKAARRELSAIRNGPKIRGSWAAPANAAVVARQSNDLGPAFDGTYGVDTEDISNIPTVDFSAFQLFPGQNFYGPGTDPNGQISKRATEPTLPQITQQGIDWIIQHGKTAKLFGKPAWLTSFGIVTKNAADQSTFIPFNSSEVSTTTHGQGSASDTDQGNTYGQWLNATQTSGVDGVSQYQWGQNFTAQTPFGDSSPTDGYAAYSDLIKSILEKNAQTQTQST